MASLAGSALHLHLRHLYRQFHRTSLSSTMQSNRPNRPPRPDFFTKADVLKWVTEPTRNPQTGYKIVPGRTTWKKLAIYTRSYDIKCPEVEFPKSDLPPAKKEKKPKRPKSAYLFWKEENFYGTRKEWKKVKDKSKWEELADKEKLRLEVESEAKTEKKKIEFIPKPNQISIVEELEEKICHRLVIINDKVGTGKTAAFLLWVKKRKENHQSYRTRVIVPRNVVDQWVEDLTNFFPELIFKAVTTLNQGYVEEEVDVLICTELTAKLPFSSDFTCFDEITSINRDTVKYAIPLPSIIITSDESINGRVKGIIDRGLLKWYIDSAEIGLATPEGRLWGPNLHLKNLLQTRQADYEPIPTNTFVTVRPTETLSFPEPTFVTHNYNISICVPRAIKFLSQEYISMLRENDFNSVITYLKEELRQKGVEIKNDDEDPHDILSWLKLIKMAELNDVTKKEKIATQAGGNVDWLQEKKLREEIDGLEKKYRSVLDGPCDICVKEKMRDPAFFKCCQHIICENCSWLLNDQCPFCRHKDPAIFHYGWIKSERGHLGKSAMKKILADIANKSRSVIIFQNSKEYLEADIEQEVGHLKGTAEQRKRLIQKYKRGLIKILFLNLTTDYSGIRLENTTDIIFLSKTSDDVRNQIIGRALRLGRDPSLPLTVHDLIPNQREAW